MAADLRPRHPDCPPADELDRLIHGRLPDAKSSAITEHVGHCCDCQERLDALAAGGDDALTVTVRQCGKPHHPPPDSAFWPALSAVEAEVTATALDMLPRRNGVTPRPSGELRLAFLQPPDSPGRIGKLGTFEIVREVGRGGMGVVLHAYDPCLQRDVAVKVLDPQLAGNEVARQRFCREARAAAAVTHENLVAVHQVDEDEASGLPYLVMQLIHGESLEQRLGRAAKMTAPEVARLGQQAAAGLAAAHAGGLIHRDIKPGNILLEDGTDRVKLTDFGLARAAEDVKLTRSGFVAGTPLYMAPEQARGEEVDARADLFSLGSVLYEAAAGRAPFDGKTPLAVLRRVADETQPSLRDADPQFPVWLSDVIDRLLEKEPADRFQTAQEVADIFAAELTRSQVGHGHDDGGGSCGKTSAYALRPRHRFCLKKFARRAVPWVAGAVVGGLVVGFWPANTPPVSPVAPDGTTTPVVDNGPPPKLVIPGRFGPVWSAAFTPDQKTLILGTEDGTLRLWNLAENDTLRTLPKMGGNIWSIDVSPDGKSMVVTSDDSEVRVFNLDTNAVELQFPHPTSTKAAVFSPDGKKVATGDRDATVRVWDMKTQIPTELRGHRGTVHSLAFSPDGKFLASAGSDGTVKVWNLDDPKADPVVLEEHEGPVYAVAFGPDPATPRLASSGWDGTVKIWNPRNRDRLHTLKGHVGDVWAVSYGGGGKLLASAGTDGTARVWDAETGKELHVLRGVGRGFPTVRFAKDGTTLAVGGRDGSTRVWEVGK